MDSRRPPRLPRGALILGSLAGVAVVSVVAWTQFRGADAPDASLLDEPAGPDLLAENPPQMPHEGDGAASPEDAVSRFLEAEASDDWAASFELLSLEDRNHFLSADGWASRRDDALGSIVDWEWTETVGDELTTRLTVTPVISLTHGVKSPEAEAVWGVVDQDGWRISLDDTSLLPVLPPDADAVATAQRWLDTDCGQDDPAGVFLASNPALAEEACQQGELSPDAAPRAPTGRPGAELQVSFGPSIALVARTIPLTSPADSSLVLVPQAEGWVVLDVLRNL